MNEQQIKALKIHFTMLKAGSEIANISNTGGVLFAFYNKLIAKCDTMLERLNNGHILQEHINGFVNWLEIEHAMLHDVDKATTFIQGGIVSPSHVDGGEYVVIKNK